MAFLRSSPIVWFRNQIKTEGIVENEWSHMRSHTGSIPRACRSLAAWKSPSRSTCELKPAIGAHYLGPLFSTSQPTRVSLRASARIPRPSMGTACQRRSMGRAVASAETYAHSSTRSVSPGLSSNLAMRTHLRAEHRP